MKKGEKLEEVDGTKHVVCMQTSTAEPMEPSEQFCPNSTCCARGQIGQGTIAIHDRKRQRYRCTICKHTDHVLVAAPRLRDCAPQRSWWSLSSRSWPLDARCKRLCRPMDWMNAPWLRGATARANSVNECMRPSSSKDSSI